MMSYKVKAKDVADYRDAEWVTGYLVFIREGDCRVATEDDISWAWTRYSDYDGSMTCVDPETVCRAPGVFDKNGKMIWENDIVDGLFLHAEPIKAVCRFKDGSFGLSHKWGGGEHFNAFTSMCNVSYEVVGNVFDNPELMEDH